ncbi:MAG: acetate kinase [Oscillospiraceae bacterium]|nr:acetate kinase [Oscillospiraceae bacterium]
MMNILVINAGSSSLKYQLLDPDTGVLLAKGLCERIGIDGKFTYKPQVEGKAAQNAVDVAMPTHSEAIQAVLNALVDAENGVLSSMSEIDAVGHRVVHGGEAFASSVLLTDEVLKAIEECNPLAPLHNPANLIGINACTAVLGDKVPQVAVFDTAFHQTMPAVAYTYAIPYEYYENDKIRRYCFHGTSHRFVSQRAAAMLGKNIEDVKIITCHLGNGSSIAAIKGGKCVDTTMGLTPLAGLPMGTRAGDMDAGVMEFLMNKYGYSMKEMMNILNKKSGVLGISGVSSDFRDLDAAAAQGNTRAKLAIDVFCYVVKKYIGSYAAAMGGVDAIVFTAGVGENSPELRLAMTEGLEYMGVAPLNVAENKKRGDEVDVSGEGSKVKVLVIPTNEELMIAMDTAEIVKAL